MTIHGLNTPRLKLSIRNRVLDLASPKIMGILNATPDSFSDGGLYNSFKTATHHIAQMVEDGADIIDVGGESTRPGSQSVGEQEEIERVIPVLEYAISQYPDIFFSVDTTNYNVAEQALKLGTHLVNDVSGLQKEPRLAELAAKFDAGYILMHSLWPPKTMQEDPKYEDVIIDIKTFFQKQLLTISETGLTNIILDPGFGFGKTDRHNFTIIDNVGAFCELGYPVMIGASRKASLGRLLNNRPADERITATVAAHYHALLNGANIIRVHDVKEAKDSLRIFEVLKQREHS